MSDDADFELTPLYRIHAFGCMTQRPPTHPRGSCGSAGAPPLWERLGQLIEKHQLPDVAFTAAGCMGFCAAGPLMVVYPEGIWYRPTTPADIDEIVDSHFRNGRRVDRLIVVPQRR
jgi:(2Fe-2S) ferredoxin